MRLMGGMCSREEVLRLAAERIVCLELAHPVRVGIDGGSASGKTFFADELAGVLQGMGREVVRAGLDGFHNPPEVRHRRGPMSVEGYVEDSFNYGAVRACVLDPLGPEGDLRYQAQVYDHQAGEVREAPWVPVGMGCILVFEGVMLFREELVDALDFKILLETSHAVALERARVRDLAHFGDLGTLESKYTRRFQPGQDLYRQRCRPEELADMVVDNGDWESPVVRKVRPG